MSSLDHKSSYCARLCVVVLISRDARMTVLFYHFDILQFFNFKGVLTCTMY